jgi:DTW domain-containing protein
VEAAFAAHVFRPEPDIEPVEKLFLQNLVWSGMILPSGDVVEAIQRSAYSPRMSEQTKSEKGEVVVETVADCPRCQKPLPLCVCDSVTPIESRISLLILQHPQEQDRALGTARLAAQHFEHAVVKVGLSWSSLSKALGRPVSDPARWAVLYLGSAKVADLDTSADVVAVNRKGEVERDQRGILNDLEGIVLLDGTWSQAKALWWRNPWMLKCQRIILGPQRPSRYGQLRREPRRDGLSTIEAVAMLLATLEKRPDIAETLHASFERMLARYREVQRASPELAPKPKPRRDYRRQRHSSRRGQ